MSAARRTFLKSLAAAPLLPALAPPAGQEIAAAVERAVAAYNAQDLAYYERSLAPDAVYVMDNGLVLSGRENVLALLNGFFAKTPKPRLVASEVVTDGRGDVAWSRFKWTPSHVENGRPGVTTAIFVRGGAGWQAVSIQSTRVGHPPRPAVPASASLPSPHGQ